MAITHSTDMIVESIPKGAISGAMIPAVVVIATVEEPCADFRIAASRNGKKIPIDCSTSACSVMNATKLVEEMITIPILVNVPEKPLPITPAMSVTGIPPIIPNTVDTKRMDRNG